MSSSSKTSHNSLAHLDEDIKVLFAQGVSPTEIGRRLEIHKGTVSRKLKRLGLRETLKKAAIIPKEVLVEIHQRNLDGELLGTLAREYGLSLNGVRDALVNRGLFYISNDQRKYKVQDDIFSKIDTQEKAYWLGYLYSDGYNREEENYFSLTQAEDSKDIIYKFKEFLSTDAPIKFYERSKINPNWQDTYTLKVTSKQASQDLAKLGCVQAKSLILKYPTEQQVPKELQRHFIRGYFDGDGSLQLNRWDIVGTLDFLSKTQEVLMPIGLNKTKIHKSTKGRKSPIWALVYGGRLVLEKIYNFLYQDATIFLDRKKLQFETNLSQLKEVADKDLNKKAVKKQAIKELLDKGVKVKDIALQYNLTVARINQIKIE